jgi:hypothetical protein
MNGSKIQAMAVNRKKGTQKWVNWYTRPPKIGPTNSPAPLAASNKLILAWTWSGYLIETIAYAATQIQAHAHPPRSLKKKERMMKRTLLLIQIIHPKPIIEIPCPIIPV